MKDVTDLTIERTRRERNNTKSTVRDVVATILDDLDRRNIPGRAVRMVAVIEVENADGTVRLESYRAGCSRYEEIALLTLQQNELIEFMRGR